MTYRGRCRAHAEAYNRTRGLDSDAIHVGLYQSDAWHTVRRRVLRACPVCARCGRWPSSVVHHRQPHGGDIARFLAPANLEALCKRCHDTHTARTAGGRARGA